MLKLILLLLLFFLLGFVANKLFNMSLDKLFPRKKSLQKSLPDVAAPAPGGMSGSKAEEPSVKLESAEKGLKELPTKESKKDKK